MQDDLAARVLANHGAGIFDSVSGNGQQGEFMRQGADLRNKRVVVLGGSSGIALTLTNPLPGIGHFPEYGQNRLCFSALFQSLAHG